MFQAAAMVATFFIMLSFLHCPGQVHYELLHHALKPIGVITLGTLLFIGTILFQVHHLYCTARVLADWLPFNFHRGKKLIALGLFWLSAIQSFDGSCVSSFSASLATQR